MGTGAVDADDLCAMVGQHHGRKGRRPKAGDLDNAKTFERTGHERLHSVEGRNDGFGCLDSSVICG